MELKSLDITIQNLIQAAVKAKDQAYCPYSSFRVGAAVLCENDSIVSGCNVENASYGLCVCAERVAIWRAVAEGHKTFRACAGDFKASCGACRQVFAEFNMDLDLYMVKPDMTVKKVTIRELLPMAFTPEDLKKERI
ncbi:hypothetical protein KUTeg_002319 [Tegillarca granosa]|uniref:Cytidine deaminase n=1 Tax=Tegillarca granosa TaxID=220873 RepID=A0ABQ9FVB6_TEGGR|nr:hypothetical protein KUTeg_002319 [Tegillarca granosa]